ncbi:hypothetical protein BJH93_15750 [Kocuria polaris]|nr:hypothetical protein [Kocuria polaris]
MEVPRAGTWPVRSVPEWPWERDAGAGAHESTGGGDGAGVRGWESEEEFTARWDATVARAPGESVAENRAGWSARNDPPPWDDDEDAGDASPGTSVDSTGHDSDGD